jgi:myo-inositol-1(or 4)-monophosphatase
VPIVPHADGLLTVAEAAARAGGAVLREGQARPKDVVTKGRTDITTWADSAAQDAIVAVIAAAFPDHRIEGEEGGVGDHDADVTWVVDPLDGTSNYAHGIPFFCVSVAVRQTAGPLLAGVVYDPLRDECFAAERGRSAATTVSTTAELSRAIVSTGIQNDDPAAIAAFGRRLVALYGACRGVRVLGSPALAMAYISCGRLDGMVQRDALWAWDVAAGIVLVEAAGGRVTGFDGGPPPLEGRADVVVSNGLLHDALLALTPEDERGVRHLPNGGVEK